MVITETHPENSNKMTHKGRNHAEKHHLAKIMDRAHNAAKEKQNGKEDSRCQDATTPRNGRRFTTRAASGPRRNTPKKTNTVFDGKIVAQKNGKNKKK
jgi:hypothetical protein